MITIFNHVCDRHPEVIMSFDKEKKLWFCEKCDAFTASVGREMDLSKSSISTSQTSGANSFIDLEPSDSADGLAEKAARMKIEELNFLEFIKKERKKPIKLDRENGTYFGLVIYADMTRVVQSSGRHELVIHDQFNPPLTQGDEVIPIEYKDGLGVVMPVKEVDKSLGR